MRLYQNPSKVKTCLNKAIKKILSDSFYIYLAWILGKVSATKSIIFFLALDQFWFSLYQKWGRPLYHFWYRLNQNWYRVDRFWSALYQFWKYTYCQIFLKFSMKSLLNGCIWKVKRILAAFIHLIRSIKRFAKLWALSAPPPGLIFFSVVFRTL